MKPLFPNTTPEAEAISTVADSLLDRLLDGVHRLALKGESMRKKAAALTKGGKAVNIQPSVE